MADEEVTTPVESPKDAIVSQASSPDRQKQLDLLRKEEAGVSDAAYGDASNPPQHFVSGAERAVEIAEDRLSKDPDNRALKEDLELKKRNLDKARALNRP